MLFTEDLYGDDQVCDYDLFVPQGEWSTVPVHLWAEHFNRPLKLRNKKMMNAFDREYIKMKGLYVFLDESQILGKTYNKFYIPNICGKICKTFLQKYASSKRYQKKIGNFNPKTPRLILRKNTSNLSRLSLKTTKKDVRKLEQFSSDKKSKINSNPIYFEKEYNFENDYNIDQDVEFSISKTSNLYVRKEISNVYKNKTIPSNSVPNNENKIDLVQDKTKVFTTKSIIKEKDDQLLREQFLVFVDKNTNFVSNNKDSEAIDEHIVVEELNTEVFISNNLKSSIKKSVRFNDTHLCSYEPSKVFVSDNLQNSIVPRETEQLFDQFVKNSKQIEKKIENDASDGIENLIKNSSEESSLKTRTEDIDEVQNQTFSPDNQNLDIFSATSNSSSIDFILPTPEILDQNTNKLSQKRINESTDRIDENEESNIAINIVHNQDVDKKRLIEDSLNEYSVERNDLNVNGSSEYHINNTLKLNVSQLHEINKSNMEISKIINESDTSESSNKINKETVDVIMKKEQENEGLEGVGVEYSSDSLGGVYEEDMFSQHYSNLSSLKSPQEIDSNASVVEDSESVKNQNKYGKSIISEDMITEPSTNVTVFDSNEQSDNKGIVICSEVDIESRLPIFISENKKKAIEDVILPIQLVSSAVNEIVISDSDDVCNNEIDEIYEIDFESYNLGDVACHNYLTPISHKESDNQLTKAPKKDKTRNAYNNSSLNSTVKTLQNEAIVEGDTGKDIDHSEQIDTKLKKQLFYLPSEPNIIKLSKNTDCDTIFNQGDISNNSQLLALTLESLSKHAFITCNINYKTDKGFQKDSQRLKKNQVKLINNEIEEDYINVDIEQTKLEDSMMKNKNESSPQTVEVPNSDNVIFVSNSCGIKYVDDKVNNKEVNIKHERYPLIEICNNDNLHDKIICEPNLLARDEDFLKVQKTVKEELKITSKKTQTLHRKLRKCKDFAKYLGKNENKDNLNIIDQTSKSNVEKHMDYIDKIIPTADQENYVLVADQNQQRFSNEQRTIHDIFHDLNEERSGLIKINKVEMSLCENNYRQIKINMDKLKQKNSELYNDNKTSDNDYSAGKSGTLSENEKQINKYHLQESDRQLKLHILSTEKFESEKFKEEQPELINKSNYLYKDDERSKMNPSGLTTEYLAIDNNKPFEVNNVRLEDDNKSKQSGKTNNDQIRLDSEDYICKDDLFSIYDKDFQTSSQKNKSNKLLSSIMSDEQVIESNVQLVVNSQNSENSDDFIITPVIDCHLPLKRKTSKVKHNTNVASLSSANENNEGSRTNCISTENVVNIIQPDLAMMSELENQKVHHQEIGPLNSEVNRQPLQNNVTSENNDILNKRKLKGKNPLLMKSEAGNEELFGNNNSNILSRQEIQRKKHRIVVRSKPLIIDMNRQSLENIKEPSGHGELIGNTNHTIIPRQEIQRKKHKRIIRSEPLVTDSIEQSLQHIEDPGDNEELFEINNSNILSRQEIQRKKHKRIIRSEPLVTGSTQQSLQHIEDPDDIEELFGNNNPNILSWQEIQRKKHRRVVRSKPLITDCNRQPLENVKDPSIHGELIGNTNHTILLRQEIQREKHQRIIRSEPLVTDSIDQTLQHIEDPGDNEELFEINKSNPLSRQEIQRKKHRSVARSKPLFIDMNRQSLENIKGPSVHGELIGNTNHTVILRQEIQRKKHKHIIRSEPLVTDSVEQTLQHIEDPPGNEELFEINKSNPLSRQEIQRKKHRSVLRSKPLFIDMNRQSLEIIKDTGVLGELIGNTNPTVLLQQEMQREKHNHNIRSDTLLTDSIEQSLQHIEDPVDNEDLFQNINSNILSRQEIQRKKHRSVVRLKPLIIDMNRQSLENMKEPSVHGELIGNTKHTIIPGQEIQRKKHKRIIRSEPLVTDSIEQPLQHIEDPDDNEELFGIHNSNILSRQEIQRKKHRSVVRSKPLFIDMNRQSLENTEDPSVHGELIGNTNHTVIPGQEIQRKKHKRIIRSEPLVTDSIEQPLQHIEDPDDNEELFGIHNSNVLSRQEIQRKKHRSAVRSKPLFIDMNRQSLENTEDPSVHGELIGNTNHTVIPGQEIQRKKHKRIIRSEPLVTDSIEQPLQHIEDPDDNEELFGIHNSNILSRQEIQRKKHRSVVRSKPLFIDMNRQSLENTEDPSVHGELIGNTNHTVIPGQEIQRKKHKRIIRSEPLVTDSIEQPLQHIEDPDDNEELFGIHNSNVLSRQEIQRKKHRSAVRSKPLFIDMNRQSLENTEDPSVHGELIGNTNHTVIPGQEIQRKKHKRIIRSEPLVTASTEQSLQHIEDPDDNEGLFGNNNPNILSRQEIQRKKHRRVLRSKPLITDCNRQPLENIKDPSIHGELIGNTNHTILLRQEIHREKHQHIIRSEPLVTDSIEQTFQHIENPGDNEELFEINNSNPLSRQEIQRKKHRSVLRSKPLLIDMNRQSLEIIEDTGVLGELFGNTNPTVLLQEEIQREKHKHNIWSDTLVTDSIEQSLQHIEDPVGNEDLFQNIYSNVLSRQEIQRKKHRVVVRSQPLIIDMNRQSLENIKEPSVHGELIGNTNHTVIPGQEIKRKKHKRIIRSETLVTDSIEQPLQHIEDPVDNEDLFQSINSNILSRQEIQRKKHQSVVRSKPIFTYRNRQSEKKIKESAVHGELIGNSTHTVLLRQEVQRQKHQRVIRSEPLVTGSISKSLQHIEDPDDNEELFGNTNPNILSRQEIQRKKHRHIIRSESLVTDICSQSIGNADNISDHNHFVMQIDVNNRDYPEQFVNMEEYFLNYKNPTQILTVEDTMKTNRNNTSPQWQSINETSRSGNVYHKSQTICERRSSTTGQEGDLNTVNSSENQHQSLGVTDNEWDINLLSDEDLKKVTCSQKSSTTSAGNASLDQEIHDAVWSETNSKSSSGGAYGFDIELPSYDCSSDKEIIRYSSSSMTNNYNINSDDSWTSLWS